MTARWASLHSIGDRRRHAPSAILLMVGTNDIFYKSNPQNAVRAEIAGMLDQVAQTSPTTHVYVSTLIPLAPASPVASLRYELPAPCFSQ